MSLSEENEKRTNSAIAGHARDALHKMMQHHLPALWWLRGRLEGHHSISSGNHVFYDLPLSFKKYSTISELPALPADNRREIIVIDWSKDAGLVTFMKEFSEFSSSLQNQATSKHLFETLSAIAQKLTTKLGGPLNDIICSRASSVVSSLKAETGNNIVPLGTLLEAGFGSRIHRTLALKAICDKLGIKVTINREEYGRWWNSVIVSGWIPSERDAPSDDIEDTEHIIDLDSGTGALILKNSVEALKYVRI
jgi:hypothetical protein